MRVQPPEGLLYLFFCRWLWRQVPQKLPGVQKHKTNLMMVQSFNYKWPRLLVLAGSLLLIASIVLPIWQIQLTAPQYPEGLILLISANGLSGDVDVINGLNHYIGMQTLHSADFIEFTLLPYLIGFFVVAGIIAVIINKKKWYYAFVGLFLLFALVSFVDFYRWEYNYGHNLDENAAIQVPGMYYQPPLIGFKQLLNFGAYSIPHIGGWVFIIAGVMFVFAWVLLLRPVWFFHKKASLVITVVVILFFQSCAKGPAPITYGKDACTFCKMNIVDKKFAAEWVTDKGKVERFDDLKCLLAYCKEQHTPGIAYINDYSGSKELLPAQQLYFVESNTVNAPMGGRVAAFENQAAAQQFSAANNGTELTWLQIEKGH